jgi:hypothetical protein
VEILDGSQETGIEFFRIADSVKHIGDDFLCGCEELRTLTFAEQSHVAYLGGVKNLYPWLSPANWSSRLPKRLLHPISGAF